ncbi:MAG: carbohydrate binding family 9 domain-containing protein, partial [Bacteroidales bacterium]|nr:carbohydrate binding family 9 domain-containing protein [Bacteroidales bacterium]
MIRQLIISTFIIVIAATALKGQTEYLPKKVYEAYRVEVPPTINGVFDDEAWSQGTWTGGFVQHEPYEGRPPSQQTEFKLAYDDMNIYVAVKALDSAPDSITNRMSRRDNADGDMVFVVFDSYHDLRTGFIFGVSSAGVRFDMIQSNNGQNEDTTWDPIWLAKAQVHNWGWGAEMKIPFTQLRFNKNSESVWGFELARQIFRENELSLWHPIPRNAPGLIHAIGELDGLQEIEPRKQLDLTPYGVAALNTYEAEEGNPYADGSDIKFNVGLDGKIGVTNNLTLDFTINPDFGQVEADPSEVNLSAFETYFPEQRPFFIEGANITSFNVGLGDGDVGNDNLFYSRRIGRRPQGYP